MVVTESPDVLLSVPRSCLRKSPSLPPTRYVRSEAVGVGQAGVGFCRHWESRVDLRPPPCLFSCLSTPGCTTCVVLPPPTSLVRSLGIRFAPKSPPKGPRPRNPILTSHPQSVRSSTDPSGAPPLSPPEVRPSLSDMYSVPRDPWTVSSSRTPCLDPPPTVPSPSSHSLLLPP